MDARRWESVCVAFDEVVNLTDAERSRRLATYGATDSQLSNALKALLHADAIADMVLEPIESALASSAEQNRDGEAFTPDIQTRLQSALGGVYHLRAELGGGGMSSVFVADEIALGRTIVLKVLKPEVAEAIGVKRLEREIGLIARLQHPHIIPLLSAGEADGVLYYTMPFVEGETLRQRLRREGELPIDDVVRITRDIASALAFAHRNGVVHRDIKPENVLLSDGSALVADFGIAKAIGAALSARGESVGPVATTLTGRGVVLGTPAYMAPEQAAGDPIADYRADLYSLGVVAHELLTGRAPFEGRSAQQLMAAHAIELPPSVLQARPNTPEWLAALVMRCLEKRPADRPRSADEILQLVDHGWRHLSATDASRGAITLGKRRTVDWRRHRVPFVIAVAGVGLAVIGLAIFELWPASAKMPAKPIWLDIDIPDSAAAHASWPTAITLARDGSKVAYLGGPRNSIFIRSMDHQRALLRIENSDGAHCPSFSPDGQWILFTRDARLMKAAVGGGAPQVIEGSHVDECAIWIDQNQILFGRSGSLFMISANGGPASLVARPDSAHDNLTLTPSQALPGGKAVLISYPFGATLESWQLAVVTLANGKVTSLGRNGFNPRYVDGYLLYANDGVLASPFSIEELRFRGPEVQILPRLRQFSTSANGGFAYLNTNQSAPHWSSIVAVRDDGLEQSLARTGSADLAGKSGTRLDSIDFAWPHLSPDGKRVALELAGREPRSWDVGVYEFSSRRLTRLTNHTSGLRPAGWTADGRNVIYLSTDSATSTSTYGVLMQPWDGSAPSRALMRFRVPVHTFSMGQAHGYAAFSVFDPAYRKGDIWIVPLDTPTAARPFIATRAGVPEPRLSHDGKLLAYTSTETGRSEVFLRPLGSDKSIQVSEGGGGQPVWSKDDRHLYYRGPSHVMRATIARDGRISIRRRDTLFRDVYERQDATDYDVFPDDKALLMIRQHLVDMQLGIVMNWPALLGQQTPRR